jgi:phenylpyruvate tautomerase PptA (4-oxalocrotonate tautomerase family)
MATSGQLTARQHKAIAALLTEPTITAAATKVGIGERTLHTWLGEGPFVDAYRGARREAVTQAVARLQQVSTAAVAVLVQVMADKKTAPGTRVSAAKTVLDMAIRAVELEDISARLEALERAAGGTS